MLVEVDSKQMCITGEGTVTPAFYADIKSMTNWEDPHEDIEVTDKDKEAIIYFITEESRKRGIPVIFE